MLAHLVGNLEDWGIIGSWETCMLLNWREEEKELTERYDGRNKRRKQTPKIDQIPAQLLCF